MLTSVSACLLLRILSISGEISTTMGETERINVLRTRWYVGQCRKRVYYPQIYDHKSHMTGEEYNDSHGDVDSGR